MVRARRIEEANIKEPIEESTEEPIEEKILDAVFNSDDNTVEFSLNGIDVTIREPNAKDFLLMESWLRNADEDYKDPQIMLIKLAQLCIVKYGSEKKVNFENFFNSLVSFDDVEVVATAIGFFRDPISKYFERLSKRINIQRPE